MKQQVFAPTFVVREAMRAAIDSLFCGRTYTNPAAAGSSVRNCGTRVGVGRDLNVIASDFQKYMKGAGYPNYPVTIHRSHMNGAAYPTGNYIRTTAILLE